MAATVAVETSSNNNTGNRRMSLRVEREGGGEPTRPPGRNDSTTRQNADRNATTRDTVNNDAHPSVDEEGFTRVVNRRRPRIRRSAVTGCKTGTTSRSVAQVRKVHVFVTRLEPDLLPEMLKEYVTELIGDECSVVKLGARYPSYS